MKRAEAWGIVACTAAAALSVALSWNRWLDPIIDAGRDLYVPLQLANGAQLDRDLAYNYPPLAPYALAGLVRIFGSSLALYIAVGFALAAVSAVSIYVLARSVAGPAGAFASTLLFVTVCVAGRPNFNFFFPYAHAMTFGAALTLLFLGGEITSPAGRDRGRAAISSLFGALACLTKLEFAAAVIACALVRRRWFAAFAFVLIALAATPFPSKLISGSGGFQQRLATGEWQHVALGTLIVACIGVLSHVRAAIWLAPLFVFVSADDLFAAAPVVHLALLPLLRRKAVLPLLWCASVASTARIALNVLPTFNGFAYVLPTIILFVYVAFTFFPKALWLALFVGVSLHALWRPREPVVRVQTIHGSYLDRNLARGRVINEVIASLPGGSLVVIPEGVSINYFSGRSTPLRTYLFTPPEFDESVTRDFAAHPPDMVLFVPRDVSDYGKRGFGIDYGQSLDAFIKRHYVREREYRHHYYAAELWRRK